MEFTGCHYPLRSGREGCYVKRGGTNFFCSYKFTIVNKFLSTAGKRSGFYGCLPLKRGEEKYSSVRMLSYMHPVDASACIPGAQHGMSL